MSQRRSPGRKSLRCSKLFPRSEPPRPRDTGPDLPERSTKSPQLGPETPGSRLASTEKPGGE